VSPEARRTALSLIAREYVLARRDLLDAIGRPMRLTAAPVIDVACLSRLVASTLSQLPPDLARRFSVPSVEQHDMVAAHTGSADVFVVMSELVDESGGKWVAALTGAVFHEAWDVLEDGTDTPGLSVDVAVNDLNLRETGGYWGVASGGLNTAVRLTGCVHRSDADIPSWLELVAYQVASSLATAERWREGATPAKTYFALLTRPGEETAVPVVDEVLRAAERFRASQPPPLRRVVDVSRVDDAVAITVPFPAEGKLHQLTTLLRPFHDHVELLDVEVPGLKVYGDFYAAVPSVDAYAWARVLNGDDDTPGVSTAWELTTPWTFGAWQVGESDTSSASLFYRGFVPATLAKFAPLEEVVRGAIREIWTASNRYRLRREFSHVVEDVDAST
jgi:hypothetical protein